MLSPIQSVPSTDYATFVNNTNANFRQIEAENRSKTILNEQGVEQLTIGRYAPEKYGIVGYDTDGVRRILIGAAPNNGRIGIWVSKPGIDVITALGG